ncbi:MAG: hypothetical protein MUE33_10470 [Cytophagaceae bacterium]|nr:hypothetical protein [Cytophagaceae bacterium]
MRRIRVTLQLFLLWMVSYTPSLAQDSIIRVPAISFWEAFLQQDTLAIQRLFVNQTDFWVYVKESYTLGVPADSLEYRYILLHQGYWNTFIHDVHSTYTLGQKAFRIQWDKTELLSIDINYLERNRSGFMFSNYETTFLFRYKKTNYSIRIDGWIRTNAHTGRILSNTLLIKKL